MTVRGNTALAAGRPQRASSRTADFMIALGLLGYPLVGTLVAFTSLPSFAGSVPIRALVLLFSLALILGRKASVFSDRNCLILMSFWLMYYCRLIWDVLIVGIPVGRDYLFTFTFFCVIPALALLRVPDFDERSLSTHLILLGGAVCVLAVLAANTGLAGERSTTAENSGRLYLETVNPITYGHVGVTTLLAALSLSRFAKGPLAWLGLAAAAGLGAGAVQLAASRGPLAALLLAVVALALANRRHRWLLGVLLMITAWMFYGISDDSESLLASRVVASAQQSDDPELRILMQAGAIEQFLESPLVGSAIIERVFQDYPHNPLIEAAMAMGVGGLGLMLTITGMALALAWRGLRRGELIAPLLVIQYVVGSQFSGNLAASSPFWMLAAYVLTRKMPLRPRRRAPLRVTATPAAEHP